ncbi:molybdopterin molybdotransferase MoeA [Paracoccus sp. TK19116]|uniref:Molybdopterin molybdenumtransferase n=1 Tax=Paracoccus albicereus TaxID=2922394 RepID=A0ABT1MPZ2_9RHOB|nr:gephyrin-like molybdotransferase Glp [Paracoccus albicereus]MCQ0970377.1 molybdopterin molybdotransferase MoeA [Paracoccus albicereus]
MITVDDALARVLALAPGPEIETVGLDEAAGRVLMQDAISRMTQPPFDAAAMDGYALRQAEIGLPLKVIGEAGAGHPFNGETPEGTAIRIFTGASVPQGYDRVVMQENVAREGETLKITDASGGPHIRLRGGDFAEGDRVIAPRLLSSADVGLLAAMNVPHIAVARRPRVAVLATGDELVRPGDTPREGQIISSNDLAVAAMARKAGAEVSLLPIARDTRESLEAAFAAASQADLIVTIGGASVGDHDLVGSVTEAMGMERSFYRIAMRPGKPLMAGRLGQSAVLGLPGNPVSAIICATLFMLPLIGALQGLPRPTMIRRARLARELPPEGPRQHYLRAALIRHDDMPSIDPFEDQDSARLSLLSRADALLVRPAQQGALQAGSIVDYIALSDTCH